MFCYNRGKTKVVRQQLKSYQLSEKARKAVEILERLAVRQLISERSFYLRYTDGDLFNRLNKRVMEIFKSIPKEHVGNKNIRIYA